MYGSAALLIAVLCRRLIEHKFYARGVGPVLALTVSGGSGREELLRFERRVSLIDGTVRRVEHRRR